MASYPLEAEWYRSSHDYWDLVVSASDDDFIHAQVVRDPAEGTGLEAISFGVLEQNKGMGTRIIMGALALASQYELRYLSGQVESPAILRIGQKIFGDAMRISLPNDVDTPLAISVDEAISSLAEQRVKQYHVISLLTDVDTTDWELPKQLNKLYEL